VDYARRIRELAEGNHDPEAIAAQLKLRPAVVRRVLGRSARRGAPRKRVASTTLSLVTTPDVAKAIRAAAAARRMPVSSVLEEIVRKALPAIRRAASPGQRRQRRHGPSRSDTAVDPSRSVPVEKGSVTSVGRRRRTLVTAADAPESVRKLLKSYDPRQLRWSMRGHRYEIVVAILTRGNEEAKHWLWSVLSRDQVRELVRKYRGAGCAEPARSLLRRQLKLSKVDVPTRPYVGFGDGVSK
jgi:hypothetical protein